MGWHHLGWEPAFFSDIDPFPRAVLSHHYPDVPLHGDFTTIGEDDYGSIELLVGGTPCQSFSVAGLRGGMDDDRGNLALEYLKLAQRKRPEWLVWENVPGVLSSNGGRDFGAFLGGLVELGYGFAYRILDAQYFGVAQRRRRVFVVGCLGDWRRSAAVLFERESLSGNPPPRRETGERVAPATTGGAGERGAVSYGIRAANTSSNGWGIQEEVTHTLDTANPHAVAVACREVAPAVTTGPPFSRTGNERVECEAIVPVVGPLTAGMGKGPRGTEAIESNHIMPVFPTLDASMDAKFGSNQWVDSGQWVFHPTQTPISNKDICHAIGANSNATAAVAFAQNSRDELRESPVVGALSTGGGKPGQGYHAVRENMKVRRLTPRECERLQGFPDDFTKIPYRNKTSSECPDGPRYKALGNSMAVPVMKWIGERIEKVARLAG